MAVARDRSDLDQALAPYRLGRERIAFVPTMGALHEGHLSLIRLARAHADRVAASIFVNPAQFAPHEDLATYPRQEAADCAALAAAGCDLVYLPQAAAMYADGFATQITMAGPGLGLESAARPHFFGGVAIIVLKLLNQVRPDIAIFGEKDYQQLLVVRALARDVDLGVEIMAGPTARADDGLALSSRNHYLSAEARRKAPALNAALRGAAAELNAGGAIAAIEAAAAGQILAGGFDSLDYVAIRRAADLAPFSGPGADGPARILAAARIDGVRLIDNVAAFPG